MPGPGAEPPRQDAIICIVTLLVLCIRCNPVDGGDHRFSHPMRRPTGAESLTTGPAGMPCSDVEVGGHPMAAAVEAMPGRRLAWWSRRTRHRALPSLHSGMSGEDPQLSPSTAQTGPQ